MAFGPPTQVSPIPVRCGCTFGYLVDRFGVALSHLHAQAPAARTVALARFEAGGIEFAKSDGAHHERASGTATPSRGMMTGLTPAP